MTKPHLENFIFVDEKINAFKFKNEYLLYNEQGEKIGMIQQRLSGLEKIRKLFVSQRLTPFYYEIKNSEEETIATIKKGWTFWMPKIELQMNNYTIGFIHQKFRIIKPQFDIYDELNNQSAKIKGNWTQWQFEIESDKEQILGHVSKKWAGIAKEIFTTADKYVVEINKEIKDEKKRMLVLCSALTIDLILKEKN